MVKKNIEEKRRKEKILKILDKNEKEEKEFLERKKLKKPKFDVSIKVHRNPRAEKQLAEKGIKINLGGILGSIFSKKNVTEGTGKVLETADKMLKDGDKEYSEFGSDEKNGVKSEYGFRMKFLDGEEKKDDKSHSKWVKKKKSEGGGI